MMHWSSCSVQQPTGMALGSVTSLRTHFLIYQGRVLLRVSHSVMSDSLQPDGLQSTRILCPWDSPGNNTGVGCHALLHGSS